MKKLFGLAVVRRHHTGMSNGDQIRMFASDDKIVFHVTVDVPLVLSIEEAEHVAEAIRQAVMEARKSKGFRK